MSAETSPDDEIGVLLQALASDDRWVRERAAKRLGELGVNNAEVVTALSAMARNDRNPYPRRAARGALMQLGGVPPPSKGIDLAGKYYLTQGEKKSDFLIGFVGWVVVVGALGLLWRAPIYEVIHAPCMGGQCSFPLLSILCASLTANLFIIGAFLLFRRWIGLGALAAFGVNSLLAVVLGQNWSAVGGFPFYLAVG